MREQYGDIIPHVTLSYTDGSSSLGAAWLVSTPPCTKYRASVHPPMAAPSRIAASGSYPEALQSRQILSEKE